MEKCVRSSPLHLKGEFLTNGTNYLKLLLAKEQDLKRNNMRVNPRAERLVVFWLLVWAVRSPFHQDVPCHRPHRLQNKMQGCTAKPTTLKREQTENCLRRHADKVWAPQQRRSVPEGCHKENHCCCFTIGAQRWLIWNSTSSILHPRTHSSCWELPAAPQPPNLDFGWVLGKHLNRVFFWNCSSVPICVGHIKKLELLDPPLRWV